MYIVIKHTVLYDTKVNLPGAMHGHADYDDFEGEISEKEGLISLAAAHAADGYARTTGRVGVCLATSGPGAANLVTGIATAAYDSVPLVCFTGQVWKYHE